RAAAKGQVDHIPPDARTAEPEKPFSRTDSSRSASHEPMTLEAIARDPWKAVDLEIPRDADPALLAGVADAAGLCVKAAAAHVRVDQIIAPAHVQADLTRGAAAAERREEVRRIIEQLPPAQRVPFLPNERMQHIALFNVTGGYFAEAQAEPEPTITAAEID